MDSDTPGTIIADLAVLGTVQRGPATADRLPAVAKSLVPEYWQPTAAVIEAAIGRNMAAGALRADGALALTEAGRVRFSALILSDTGSLACPAALALEALQFCFLDCADADTAARALARLAVRLEHRLTDLEIRCRQCPHRGRYAALWMEFEQRRLKEMARLLAAVSCDAATSEPVSHPWGGSHV